MAHALRVRFWLGSDIRGMSEVGLLYPQLRTFVVLPQRGAHWSLITLRDKFIKIGAKVIPHGRYVAFQMAAVAASHYLFAHILGLNSDLQAPPAKPQCKK